MNASEFESMIRTLVAAKGPKPSEYEDLSARILQLQVSVQRGEITRTEIIEVLNLFPDQFSEKTLQGCALRKPHGYAGDYEMMEKIYSLHISSDPDLANWDRYFQAQHAPQAVRNRKNYFHTVLDRHTQEKEATVLKLGVGPGRSMYEWLERTKSTRVNIECVDVDQHAINYAADLTRSHSGQITFHHRNVFKFIPAQEQQYDLIWAAGLFDYFDDATFLTVASRFFRHLSPKGEFIIGNFSAENPTRPYMELFGDWNLHHRSADQLCKLAAAIGASPSTTWVGREQEGVNLFLHMQGA